MSAERRITLGHLGILLCGISVGAAGVLLWLAEATPHRHPPAPLPADPWVEMTASTGYLTEIVDDALATTRFSALIDQVHVDTADGAITISATVVVLGNELYVRATLEPHVDDGRVQLEVTETRVGMLPLPLERIVERALDAQLQRVLHSAELEVTGLVVHDHGITLTGHAVTRP